MTCSQCGQAMWLNGSMWQCPAGHLTPKSNIVPDGVNLLPLAAQ